MHIARPTAARADDGTAIADRTRGTGPIDVLFMHGWGGSGASFDEILKWVDLSGVRVTTVDLRGHGASDKPEGTYSLDGWRKTRLASPTPWGHDGSSWLATA